MNEEMKKPQENRERSAKNFDAKNNKRKPRRNFDKPKSDLEEKVICINRVTKVVKGGRQFRFAATVVVGNRKGKVGIGLGKAKEMPDAVKKATQQASKNLINVELIDNRTIAHEMPDAVKKATQVASKNFIKVDLVDNRTISHDIIVKEGACRVMLKPAKEGTGVKAGGPVRDVLELAGVKDVLSKSQGSSTKINAARATLNALKGQKSLAHVAYLRDKNVEEIR